MNSYSIALSAGEASGDLHGSFLVGQLSSKLVGNVRFWGGGGQRMENAGVDLVINTSGGGTIGVFETLASLPGIYAKYRKLRKKLLLEKPDLLIPIDFGAFNIRLAKCAYDNGIDVVYYIPPGSWRTKVKGVEGLLACGGKVVTPFSWSAEELKKHGIDACWPGHPLLDIVKPNLSPDEFRANYNLTGTVVSLFPGSRSHELKSHLPELCKTMCLISHSLPDVSFVVGAAAGAATMEQMISGFLCSNECYAKVVVLENQTYDCMAGSDFGLVTSGTATLEAAIIGLPMIIIYKGTRIMNLEFLMRKGVIETFIGLPNLLAGEQVVPEMLGSQVTGQNMAKLVLDYLSDRSKIEDIQHGYSRVRKLLGGEGALGRAADAVIDLAGLEKLS